MHQNGEKMIVITVAKIWKSSQPQKNIFGRLCKILTLVVSKPILKDQFLEYRLFIMNLKGAINLKKLWYSLDVHVMSAHRTPKRTCAFVENARENGFGVIIAAAEKRRILRDFAAHTTLTVIGIPCKSSALDGLDAFCHRADACAIPVATVAIASLHGSYTSY
jgi:hypothetical protein